MSLPKNAAGAHPRTRSGGALLQKCMVATLVLLVAFGATDRAHAAEPPPELSSAKTAAAAGLVDIRTLVPDIAEDIKYAGSDNFGAPPSAKTSPHPPSPPR